MPKILPQATGYNPGLADTLQFHTASPRTAHAGLSATVLVIEDDEGVRHLIRRTLEAVGYKVLEAEDGEEGLRMVELHAATIDLVLTDIEMPRLDGISVARTLAAKHPRIRVVCMSGRLEDTAFQERIGLPAPPFLAKPFSFDDLARIASETLAPARHLSA